MFADESVLQDGALLWLLGSLCSIFRQPFDGRLIEQAYPPPHNLASFQRAAQAIGLKTGRAGQPADWRRLPVPALAFFYS